MFITIQSSTISANELYEKINKISSKNLKFEDIFTGELSSISQEAGEFLSTFVNISSNISIHLLAVFLYDLIKTHRVQIKIEKKVIEANSPPEEIESLLKTENGVNPLNNIDNNQKLIDIRKLIETHFSLEELHILCFDLNLGIDYENLEGSTKTSRIFFLINYLQRRNELDRLIEVAKIKRPNVNWAMKSES